MSREIDRDGRDMLNRYNNKIELKVKFNYVN